MGQRNRSVDRTKKALREAAVRLAEQCDLAEITVQDIVDEANVGRATFYFHYANKDALVEEVFDLLFAELSAASETFLEAFYSDVPIDPGVTVVNFFEALENRRHLYQKLFQTGAGIRFADRLQAYHESIHLEMWQRSGRTTRPGTPPISFRARYAAAGSRGIINLWLDDIDLATAIEIWRWSHRLNSRVIGDDAFYE